MVHVDSQMLNPLDVCEILFGKNETTGEALAIAPVDNTVFTSFSDEGNFIEQ